jgi:glycosyltransferase involved in cell wall biosynthesis
VFDRVHVIARLKDVPVAQEGAIEASGVGVVFNGLPSYRGPTQFLRHGVEMRSAALRALRSADAIILRVPSPIASLIAPSLQSRGIPYAVEVVGDPYDVFSPGAVRHPLRPLIRWKMTRDLKRQVRGAVAAAYVTQSTLQRRYPCGAAERLSRFVTHYSSVELGPDAFVAPQATRRVGGPLRLINVGTFEQLYKGQDVLVDAVRICVSRGLDIALVFIGGGIYLEEIRRRAERHRLGDRVRFAGHLSSRAELVAELDASDLFVLPSRQEGLPRAMIEAMARGLPCVGSDIGGIPELLDREDLVPPGDAIALATRIEDVARDSSRWESMRGRSLDRAREFAAERLAVKRAEFYRQVLRVSSPGIEAA